MKLCIVVPYFTPYVRGNEYGLAESLTKLGYDVTIIASKGKAPREVKKEFAGEFDFKVKYLPTLLDIGENPVVSGLNLEGYDVALLQEDYPFICHKAYAKAKKRGIKTILSSERTYYPEGIKGTILKIVDKAKNEELRESVDVLTAHCSAAKDFMERELGVKREIEIIHVGVDTELFKPNRLFDENGALSKKHGKLFTENCYAILTVARLHKYKGLEYLIEAMRFLQDQIPEAKLYILGKGPEEENLQNLVKKLSLEGKVEFIEKAIPNYEMPFLYGECDIYVQPSIIEPYGIAVLEAMACGKPVVGTKVGGMQDTIKEGETGFIVEPRNAGEIADRLKILRDGDKRAEMGKSARKWVVDNFDWMVVGKEYQEVIKEVL
jgi:glycosyltransferase involved in cell wall biosynthesis